MKVKSYPEDFLVKEILDLEISSGPYSYYLLKKRNLNLFHVFDVISERWKISRERIGYCGIKDKRALTEQYLSIKDGPEKSLRGKNFEITFIGKGDKPLKIGDAHGNLFRVTLRNVLPQKIVHAFNLIGKIGFANYFGKQRFTPDLYSQKPIARLLLEGKFEETLREYFFHHPSPLIRERLVRNWSQLSLILKDLPNLSKMDKIVLRRFAKRKNAEYALRAYPKAIKLMFFFSYQSLIWNRILNELVSERAETFAVKLTGREKISFYKSLTPGLRTIQHVELPFISEEVYFLPSGDIVDKVIRWIEKEQLRPYLTKEVLGLKAFSAGKRRIITFPDEMEICEVTKDTATLQFFLPSGSYATVFLLKLLNYPV